MGGTVEPEPKMLSTLQRGLRLLEAIAEENGEATAKQLSKRVDTKLGACYHTLRTLQDEGYVVRLPGGRYGLNGRVAFLQDSLRSRLAPDPAILSILREVHLQVNETTYTSGWRGNDIVLQWYLEAKRTLHVRSLDVGYSQNTHARASGKAILAFLPESRVRTYFAAKDLPRLTTHTITDLDTLLRHLAAIARRGFAVDREEFSQGVCCIGAAYFDQRAFPVGAFAVSVPTVRYADGHDDVVRVVVDAAKQASQRLGYAGPYPPRSPLAIGGADDT